jgi:hypothetical protein
MNIEIPTSVGDLIDRVTILSIKDMRMEGFDTTELEELNAILGTLPLSNCVRHHQFILLSINEEIWEVEDFNRQCERDQEFGEAFIDNARSVYMLNDLRAQVKRTINKMSGSALIEYKSHEGY